MKLYNKKDFLKLPAGTIYFDKPYELDNIAKLYVGKMHIKGESLNNDFFIDGDINSSWFKEAHSDTEGINLWHRLLKGEEFDVDFACGYRDGMYDSTDQYYVLNRSEVKELIKVLTEAYNMAYKNKQE